MSIETWYTVYGADGQRIMYAPMRTVAQVFACQKEAIERIRRETEAGGRCKLHFNGRYYLNEPAVEIERNVGAGP